LRAKLSFPIEREPSEKGDSSSVQAPLPSCSGPVTKPTKSPSRIIYCALDVKGWLEQPPNVDAVRPGQCPGCKSASRPVGHPLGMHGHGLRERQVRGPPEADAAPTVIVVQCRRYRCLGCGAILLVVPRGIAPRKHYGHAAISMAFALWGLVGRTAWEVRTQVCAWRIPSAAATGWATLRRWAQAAGAASGATQRTPSAVAARVAQIAIGRAPPCARGAPLWAQAFAGGSTMT
jgi:hypothetical protein